MVWKGDTNTTLSVKGERVCCKRLLFEYTQFALQPEDRLFSICEKTGGKACVQPKHMRVVRKQKRDIGKIIWKHYTSKDITPSSKKRKTTKKTSIKKDNEYEDILASTPSSDIMMNQNTDDDDSDNDSTVLMSRGQLLSEIELLRKKNAGLAAYVGLTDEVV